MITIVFQAGGQSLRMGQDKGLMPFLGVPLLERLRDRFQILEAEMVVVTNQPGAYEYLGLPLYQDLLPGRGALGGLLTALTIARTRWVGLLAADMPFASPRLLAALLERIQTLQADAVIPSTEGGLEPFHAVYARETCLPLVEEAIRNDLWRMTSWHDQANIRILDPAETARAADTAYAFLNLNTPLEFREAEALASRLNLV